MGLKPAITLRPGIWVLEMASAVAASVWLGVRPSTWPRPTRDVLARQVLFTGVDALGFTVLIAVLVGVSVVLQAQLWLGKLGQSELLGPLLVTVLVREVCPFMANFIVIGRSGTAIATEIATMNVHGEIDLLERMGIEPFRYLVIPRTLAVGISVFGLTMAFLAISFTCGYLSTTLFHASYQTPLPFLMSVLRAIDPADPANLVLKSVVPGMCTGAICTLEGWRSQQSLAEVPRAATRGVERSVATLFVLLAVFSVTFYV